LLDGIPHNEQAFGDRIERMSRLPHRKLESEGASATDRLFLFSTERVALKCKESNHLLSTPGENNRAVAIQGTAQLFREAMQCRR
jgi:hypothetical protein